MTPLRATLLGGLIAGVLDLIYACIHNGIVYSVAPTRILQAVASGLLGRAAARAGGLPAAALGFALEIVMTTIMAAVFVYAALRIRLLVRWPIVSAIVYGLILYGVMNYVVVPFSRAGDGTPHPPEGQFFWGALFAHIVLVALPITLLAARARSARV
jgi:hypothetical protein